MSCEENMQRHVQKAKGAVMVGRFPGGEADFSTALFAKYANSFGRNDDFWGWRREQAITEQRQYGAVPF